MIAMQSKSMQTNPLRAKPGLMALLLTLLFDRRWHQRIGRIACCCAAGFLPLCATVTMQAQTPAPAASSTPAASSIGAEAAPSMVQVLLTRAQLLTARGQASTATQVWQQVLLADPQNAEALSGLARYYRQRGDRAQSEKYLALLQQFHPNDPEIVRIEHTQTQATQQQQLAAAGKLAMSGHPDQAMAIYRGIYGEQPPDGDIALAYYETEAALPEGKAPAIAGFRGLVLRYPSDTRYAIALGRILTEDPATREAGIGLLQPWAASHADAAHAVHQAWLWQAQDPAHAAEVRQYLAAHPDAVVQQQLEKTLAQAEAAGALVPVGADGADKSGSGPGIAQTPAEAEAFQALHAGNFARAEHDFRTILKEQASDGPALAGMGFVRLRQQKFEAAERYLELAQKQGVPERFLRKPLATATFWQTVQQAVADEQSKNWEAAKREYKKALLLQPLSVDAWRGLMATDVQAGDPAAALDLVKKIPDGVDAQLQHDGGFVQSEAAAEDESGQTQKAQELLAQALALPSDLLDSQTRQKLRLQSAAMFLRAGQTARAQARYQQVLATDANNAPAWQGQVQALHQGGEDTAAWKLAQSMPPDVLRVSLLDPGFLSTLASVAASQGQLTQAQQDLQQAMQQIRDRGQHPPPAMQMQSADLYLQQKQPERAALLYRKVLATADAAPRQHYDATLRLLVALHAAGEDQLAAQQQQALPADLRQQLNHDPEFLQTMASVEESLGNPKLAISRLQQIEAMDASSNQKTSANVELNLCWLLYRTHQGAELLQRLKALDSQKNLTPAQQHDVSQIWILWSLRRTDRYRMQGEYLQAAQLQQAAHAAFPQNSRLRGTLAGTYIEAHEAKKTVAMYADRQTRLATPEDVRAAIGAAMATGQNQKAAAWLQEARARYPQNPALLVLYAKWEEIEEQDRKAIDHLRQAIQMMPVDYQVDRPTTEDVTGKTLAQSNATSAESSAISSPTKAAPQANAALSSEDQPASIAALNALGAALQAQTSDKTSTSKKLSRAVVLPAAPATLRNQAIMQLGEIESRLSPWIGGIPYVNHRSGTQGIEQMTDIEIPVALSMMRGNQARITVIAQPAYITDGVQSIADLLPVGTLAVGVPVAAQTAQGVAGELQLSTRLLDMGVGTTPQGFLVSNLTGRAALRLPQARLTFTFVRDSVRDSELSYAGLRNPDTAAPYAGKIWGGVVSNLGGLDWSHGGARKGVYFTGSGGVLTGTHVQTNNMAQVDTGTYWRLLKKPGGKLMLATNFFGMHYAHDELYFSYGQGGYFSPEYFLLGNLPLTWTGNHAKNFHYDLEGTLGVQHFHQSSAEYFPLDPALQSAPSSTSNVYAAQTTTGLNYGVQADAAWLLGGHWYIGGFVNVNDAQNYNQQIGGFSLHYAFRRQHPRQESPTGIFPYSGMNTLKLP